MPLVAILLTDQTEGHLVTASGKLFLILTIGFKAV